MKWVEVIKTISRTEKVLYPLKKLNPIKKKKESSWFSTGKSSKRSFRKQTIIETFGRKEEKKGGRESSPNSLFEAIINLKTG